MWKSKTFSPFFWHCVNFFDCFWNPSQEHYGWNLIPRTDLLTENRPVYFFIQMGTQKISLYKIQSRACCLKILRFCKKKFQKIWTDVIKNVMIYWFWQNGHIIENEVSENWAKPDAAMMLKKVFSLISAFYKRTLFDFDFGSNLGPFMFKIFFTACTHVPIKFFVSDLKYFISLVSFWSEILCEVFK